MKTAEALERIPHANKFELLVTSVLSNHNKDYAAIIHSGINAQEETIKSPVDGFCQVPGSEPPRFLFVAHSKTDREKLKNKWLYDHRTTKSSTKTKKVPVSESGDGDLLKAAREAQELKNDFPDGKFIVILTTNQRLSKCLSVVKEVYKKARELGVEVEIWEQSRLARILDSTTEGHWLRKEHLDIDAEMLSKSLLRDLCKQSLVNYQKVYIPSPDSLVPREIDSQIEKGKHSNAYTIQLLIGESGYGKTAAAYQLLKNHIESGGYGLWVSDDVLKDSNSLPNVLDRVLGKLYPRLLPDAGRSVLQFIPGSSRLLLIIDDVNRTDNPTRLLQEIINWFKPQQSGTSDSQPIFSPYLVVCPVWSKFSSPISLDFKEKPWINPVSINLMNLEEGMAAIQAVTSLAGREITNTEAAFLATKLGNDPILIGLFYELLLSNSQQDELERFTENVIEQFITTTLSESSNSGKFIENEYRASLSTVATQMLKSRKLYPLWTDIGEWLRESPDKLNALRELIKHKALCRLTQEDKFVFRHDRIQETLLVESMIKLLADTTRDPDILYEPFYAEIIGQAIAGSPQSKEFLRELRNRLPLALVEAIRSFGAPTSDYHQVIIEEVKEWANSSVATHSVPKSLLDAVCWSLSETDSPVVIEITENTFPAYPSVLLARLRNGCANSGALYYGHYWHLGMTDSWVDPIVRHAKQLYGNQLRLRLKQLLIDPKVSDELRRGLLVLAGILSFEIQEEIGICWKLLKNKKGVLAEAIWAATRCCTYEPNKLLDPMIAYWAELPEEEDQYIIPPMRIARSLWIALEDGIQDRVINYLVSQCDVHESLRWPIMWMCSRIDSPNAVEFIVKGIAEIKRIRGTENCPYWLDMLTDNWDTSRTGRRLSETSMIRLKALWEDPNNDDFLKKQAFDLWITGIEWEQIDILRAISSNFIFCESVLRKRIELGDRSVVQKILSLISEDINWFWSAHHVWCEELMVVAQNYLQKFKDNIPTDFSGGCQDDHFILSRLLMLIPVKDAEMLLDKYWNHLGYSPLFIQTALYVGTPKCLELAKSSISRCPINIRVLQYVHSHFGCMEDGMHEHLTVQHIENLVPYLHRLDEFSVWMLAEACQRMGIPERSQQYLSIWLSEKHRKRYHPSDDDLLQDLDKFAAEEDGVAGIRYWLEEFDKRHDPKSRTLKIVDCWLAFNPTIKGLQIATACIQAVGTRKDLSILDQYTIEGSPDEIARIKESTRFAVYRRSLD